MDLTTGLLKSNEAISQADPTGKYITGFNAGQVARSNATKNEKDRWELDNQEKLQKAIAMSVDENHNLVPDLLLKNGHAMGIDQQVLDHAVKFLPAQWESVRKTAQEKNTLSAVNTPMADKTAASVAGQGDKAASAASQSSTNAVAVPAATTAAPPAQSSTAQPPAPWASRSRQPMLAPLPGDMVVPTTPMGEGQPTKVIDNSGNEWQANAGTETTKGVIDNGSISYNQDGTPVNPNKSIFQIANEVPAEPMTPVPSGPIANPIQLSNLGSDEQKQIMTAMQQAGLLSANATVAQAQAAADADMAQIMAQVVPPNKKMFIGQDGQFDVGAYNKALAEYPAKQAKALDDVKSKYGKYYSDMIAQKIAVQGNERAAQTQQTEQKKLQSDALAYEEKAKNINEQLGSSFKPISSLALQKGSPAQVDALTNGAKAYATLMELDAKCKAENRNPTNAEIAGATSQLMQLDGMGANMANEEKIKMLLSKGIISKAQALLLGNTPAQEIGSSIAKLYIAKKMGSDESIEDMVKSTSYPALHKQFEGESSAFSGSKWTNKPAKNLGSKSNPIPYTKGMKAVKGKFYNVPGHGGIEGTD